ncbi:MAG: hypothetical protein E3K37_12430 [Candidatus Kuenenia sp.]|nr:hypothetical protein [Candidatus Kuenenia hertensis]
MIFKDIFSGIDSLYVSYKGKLKEGIVEILEEKKTIAQSGDEKFQSLATFPIEDHIFEVLDKGARNYSYVLVDNWYRIQISKGKRVPPLYVQISSELLNCYGVEYSLYKLREIISHLITTEKETISRSDIFVDFITNYNLEEISKSSWITTGNTSTAKYWEGNKFTGWTIGMKGDISVRLYNKSIELQRKPREYLKEIWETNGWDRESQVWRLEFELKRGFLKHVETHTYSDLQTHINDLWRYCTGSWLRMSIPEPTINRSRWATLPLWEKIQEMRFLNGTHTGITRYVDKSRLPSEKTMLLNGMGYFTSFMAREGYEEMTEEVLKKFYERANSILEKATKHSDHYQGVKDYVMTKVKSKKRRYNKKI